ncbi:MAG: lysophospholipase, partial [Proteobacteria bacterium]|nr:lysophospholipase [Pseudomonadota bacterium]
MIRRGALVGLAGLAAIAGCAHTPDPGFRADPSGTLFEARDGTKLFARHWVATGEVRGVVVIVHGLKDYSARYDATATRLAAGGYSVYAFDLRGHGRSAGPRVDPGTWTRYVDDLEQFLTRVETAEPARPVFLFGHSMGGAIATLAAERHRSPSGGKLAGLALSGPALVVHAQPVLLASLALTGATMPKFPVLDLPNENFSSEVANALRMADDPLISQPVGPARTAAGLVDGMRQIWAGVDALTMPILAMHGTADK